MRERDFNAEWLEQRIARIERQAVDCRQQFADFKLSCLFGLNVALQIATVLFVIIGLFSRKG